MDTARIWPAFLTAILCASAIQAAEPALSQLTVEQAIRPDRNGVFQTTPALHVAFVVARPAEVTLTIARHLAGWGALIELYANYVARESA